MARNGVSRSEQRRRVPRLTPGLLLTLVALVFIASWGSREPGVRALWFRAIGDPQRSWKEANAGLDSWVAQQVLRSVLLEALEDPRTLDPGGERQEQSGIIRDPCVSIVLTLGLLPPDESTWRAIARLARAPLTDEEAREAALIVLLNHPGHPEERFGFLREYPRFHKKWPPEELQVAVARVIAAEPAIFDQLWNARPDARRFLLGVASIIHQRRLMPGEASAQLVIRGLEYELAQTGTIDSPQVLGALGEHGALLVSPLLTMLSTCFEKEPWNARHVNALRALGHLGPAARAALPTLRALRGQTRVGRQRLLMTRVILSIDPADGEALEYLLYGATRFTHWQYLPLDELGEWATAIAGADSDSIETLLAMLEHEGPPLILAMSVLEMLGHRGRAAIPSVLAVIDANANPGGNSHTAAIATTVLGELGADRPEALRAILDLSEIHDVMRDSELATAVATFLGRTSVESPRIDAALRLLAEDRGSAGLAAARARHARGVSPWQAVGPLLEVLRTEISYPYVHYQTVRVLTGAELDDEPTQRPTLSWWNQYRRF